ncbi:hypothetical protein ARAM_002820 [Aspergillus rambellii]|uniref:C2H2-type domain-containing protein n=1 Tax=Aspergillus rambellii TaxID=308745 RepID=A0A0F8XUP2_9EURO|nr:hypothetical protein ARAM_002820 [Aspergillus rambellii]
MAKRSRSSQSPSADPSEEIRQSRPSSPESLTSSTQSGRTKIHLLTPSSNATVMRCSLPPHRETLSFSSYEDYEVHYLQSHVNRCSECGKNFPTDRFLNLHIEENHDPLVASRRERGEKTTYNFYIVNDGVDKQTSMLRSMHTHRRRLSATPSSPQEGRLRHRQTSISLPVPAPEPGLHDAEIAELEKSMSALRFVPASVTNRGRIGNRS